MSVFIGQKGQNLVPYSWKRILPKFEIIKSWVQIDARVLKKTEKSVVKFKISKFINQHHLDPDASLGNS